MMQTEPSHPDLSSSPSFSSYSSETLAQIAARVIHELRTTDPHNSLSLHDDTLFYSWEHENDNTPTTQQGNHHHHGHGDPNLDDVVDDDDDFEFASVSRDPNSSPASADDIFYNGQIKPTYPLFDRNLLNAVVSVSPIPTTNAETVGPRRRRLPLRKLMFEEEQETDGSCSSSTSEADDSNGLNGVAAGTYCLWTPSCKKKSNSMGSSSSKRWKLRDLLLLRSHSDDGKKEPQPLLFTGPTKHTSAGNGGAAAKDGDHAKRKSFLPYRQELVGIFSNGNGLGPNLQPC